jgi:NADPH:quinone reductase-like Zn-dependent oxidoreductase
MTAMGHVTDRAIGGDAAGIVTRVGAGVSRLSVGDRVAVLHRGAMRTTLRVDGSIPQKLPEDISMQDGATLPTIYVMAYHILVEVARLQKGDSVLIHRASGGELILAQIESASIWRLTCAIQGLVRR